MFYYYKYNSIINSTSEIYTIQDYYYSSFHETVATAEGFQDRTT